MNNVLHKTADTLLIAPGKMRELVRGQEQLLLEQISTLVRQHNVSLDLRQVERIDAAGIAALISLYVCAHETGHVFTILQASERIEEILSLVGLDHILLSHNAVTDSQSEPCMDRSAA